MDDLLEFKNCVNKRIKPNELFDKLIFTQDLKSVKPKSSPVFQTAQMKTLSKKSPKFAKEVFSNAKILSAKFEPGFQMAQMKTLSKKSPKFAKEVFSNAKILSAKFEPEFQMAQMKTISKKSPKFAKEVSDDAKVLSAKFEPGFQLEQMSEKSPKLDKEVLVKQSNDKNFIKTFGNYVLNWYKKLFPKNNNVNITKKIKKAIKKNDENKIIKYCDILFEGTEYNNEYEKLKNTCNTLQSKKSIHVEDEFENLPSVKSSKKSIYVEDEFGNLPSVKSSKKSIYVEDEFDNLPSKKIKSDEIENLAIKLKNALSKFKEENPNIPPPPPPLPPKNYKLKSFKQLKKMSEKPNIPSPPPLPQNFNMNKKPKSKELQQAAKNSKEKKQSLNKKPSSRELQEVKLKKIEPIVKEKKQSLNKKPSSRELQEVKLKKIGPIVKEKKIYNDPLQKAFLSKLRKNLGEQDSKKSKGSKESNDDWD
jgi:hypothetical protein